MTPARGYHLLIVFLDARAGGPDKFLHINAGLVIWVLAAAAMRVPLTASAPLVTIAAIEVVNELLDRLYMGRWMWADTIGDVTATCFWPVVLTLILRHWPGKRGDTADRA